ncbi:hypothetical protein ABJI51_39260 [Amycolatopsis sp. NEAU-NG30]|uniref:Uncharacterized protein n=1 Tax=Amycolatopsis melonis TaxID=3156488 RepID=A0ABV0LS59_9PSEU
MLLSTVLMAAGVLTGTGTAHASEMTSFYACVYKPCDLTNPNDDFTAGNITWYNWAVTLNGTVYANPSRTYTVQAVFDAFNGSTRIGSEGRTVVEPADQRSFEFDMGGGSAAGKVDRIRITIVRYWSTGGSTPGEQFNFARP